MCFVTVLKGVDVRIVNKPIAIISSLIILIALQIILGRMISPKWFLVFANSNGYADFMSGFFLLASGVTLFITGTDRKEWFFLSQAICGFFIIICSLFILLSSYFGAPPSLDFLINQWTTFAADVPVISMKTFSTVLWCGIGMVFWMSSRPITRASFVALQVITMLFILFDVIGFINYLSVFELIYGGKDVFSINAYAAFAMIFVALALFKTWGNYPDYLEFYKGREEVRYTIFASILMIYVSTASALIGFAVVAQQSESFLKSAIENSLSLKSEIIKNTVKTEISALSEFTESVELTEYLSKNQTENIHIPEKLIKLFEMRKLSAWRINNHVGHTIQKQGDLINDLSVSLGLHVPKTSLVWSNGWYLHAERDLIYGNKNVGTLIIEKPLHYLDSMSNSRIGMGKTEKTILCTIIDPGHARCFQSSSTEHSFAILSLLSDDGENPLIRAFQGFSGVMVSKVIHDKPMISAYMPLTDLGLVATLNVDVEEIYDAIYNKLKITMPMIVFCVVISIIMLAWHIIPLIQKMLATEKEAIENTKLLKESETTMRSILNNIGEAIITFDIKGNVETINSVAEDLFGWSHSEIVDKNASSLIYIGGQEASQRMLEVFSVEKKWNEVIAIRKNGSFFSAEFYLSEIFVRQRKVYVGILRDITERKRTEQRIQESENRFRMSFDFAPIGMALLSVDGHWMQVNQALSNIVGFAESELLHKSIFQVIHGNDYENSKRVLGSVFSGDINTAHVEQRFIHKSGKIVWVFFNVFMLTDEDEKPLYIIAQIQDISERKVVEEELRGANEQLKGRFEELEHHNRESILMTEMSRILQSCHTSEESFEPIESYCRQLMPEIAGILYLVQSGDHYMEQVATWGNPCVVNPVFQKQDCWALRRGQIHQVDSAHSHIYCGHVDRYKEQVLGHLCIPLMAQGETIGLLYIEIAKDSNYAKTSAVIPESLRVLSTILGDHIALALSNIRLRETLQHQSIHDVMTGLYNRRYLEEFMRLEFLRATRKSSSLAILMLDVDHFKLFNDTFGHDAGDLVLQEVASVLIKNVRDSDIACRWGGEEFVLLMPEANPEIALQRAQAIREQVHDLQMVHAGRSLGEVTISIGVALYPENGGSAETVMEAADRALYEAKHSGRDRVVMASKKVEEA